MNSQPNNPLRVCVYCASSDLCDDAYKREAYRLGALLAESRVHIVYGGGGRGLMGQLAAGALARGGQVTGIMPRFMQELEWGHTALSELQIVEDMRERKHRMLTGSNAAIALPGGCGTLEELLEAITLKRLGLYDQPIVIVNIRDYFDPLLDLLHRAVREQFMEPCHLELWRVAKDAYEAVELALGRKAAAAL